MTTQNQPTHRLYTVKGNGDVSKWLEIGAAWSNRDGNGFTLQLDALPTDGRIVMRVIAERDEQGND